MRSPASVLWILICSRCVRAAQQVIKSTSPSPLLTSHFLSELPFFSLCDWAVRWSITCAHIFAQSLQGIDLTLRHPPVMIDAAGPTETVNEAARRVWPVRREEFMIPEFYLCGRMSCFTPVWLACTPLHLHMADKLVCVCVGGCVLQSTGCVAVPRDTQVGPTWFWGREDKREINCSTPSPASARLLRERFAGWSTSQSMKGWRALRRFDVPGRSCDPAMIFCFRSARTLFQPRSRL